MKTTVVAIGKFRNKELLALAKDYAKRLRRHIAVELLLVKTEEKLLEKLTPRDELILLEATGVLLDSAGFAKKLQNLQLRGLPHLVFVIGEAAGFSDAMEARAQWSLSLSPMTFQHEMAFALFLEQLYRAVTILHGMPYHK